MSDEPANAAAKVQYLADMIPKHEEFPPFELFNRAIVDGKNDRFNAYLLGQITIDEGVILIAFEGKRMAWTNMAVQALARFEIYDARGEHEKAMRRLDFAERVFAAFSRPRERWLTKQIAKERAAIEESERRWDDSDFIGPQHPDMWSQSMVRQMRSAMKGHRPVYKFLQVPLNEPAWIAGR